MDDALLLISDTLAKCERLHQLLENEHDIKKKAEYALRQSMLFDLLQPFGEVWLQETTNMYIMNIVEVRLEREREQITVSGTVGANGYDVHMVREPK